VDLISKCAILVFKTIDLLGKCAILVFKTNDLFGKSAILVLKALNFSSERSILAFKSMILIFKFLSGVLGFLKTSIQDFDISIQVISNNSFVVEVEASSLQSLDLNIFILRYDFLSIEFPDDVDALVSEISLVSDNLTSIIGVVHNASVEALKNTCSFVWGFVSGGWSPILGWRSFS
jgi:hypothetical protein